MALSAVSLSPHRREAADADAMVTLAGAVLDTESPVEVSVAAARSARRLARVTASKQPRVAWSCLLSWYLYKAWVVRGPKTPARHRIADSDMSPRSMRNCCSCSTPGPQLPMYLCPC